MAVFSNLFDMNQSRNAHQQIFGNSAGDEDGQAPLHHSSWTHELLAGAAAFAAMKAYEDHVRSIGGQVSHPVMKDMLASLAAVEVDKLFETKGLDFLDREEAKRRAVHQAHRLADEKYGSGGTFNGQSDQHHHFHHHHHSEQE